MEQLIKAFNNCQYLKGHCENIDIALSYYDGEKDAGEFIEWYRETYIYSAEVVYYHNAIKILADDDPSLRDSLTLAADMGYALENVNSELLATLLLREKLGEELAGLQGDVEEYFEVLEG